MIKKEFYNWIIDTYGDKPGAYTEDELYVIGSKHKDLEQCERSWGELAAFLKPQDQQGKTKSGETFRIWIKGRQYQDGSIKKNWTLLSGQTVGELSYEEFQQNVAEQKRELYKQQTRTRDEHNSYRATLRDEARIERIKETIGDSIKELKDLPEVVYEGPDFISDKEAVLLFSDLHIGVFVDSFYNKYNIEIARKRVKKLTRDTIDMCLGHEISRLNILSLGDAISGHLHITGRILDEVDVITEVTTAAEIIADMLVELQQAAPEVIYRSCTDNHSRITPNYKEHIEKESLGRIIDWYIEERLKDSKVIFANDNLECDLGLFTLLNGENVMFAHGHREHIASIVQDFEGVTRQHIDYIAVGHFHTSKMKSFQNTKVFVNGSICGPEEYAYSRRLFSQPEQTLLLFENGNVIVNYINLNIK